MSKTTIPTGGLADSAVTTAKITDATIASGDLADDAVTAAKIADAVPLGKVLQVVQALFSTSVGLTGTSFTNITSGGSTLEAAITPASTSNKVFVEYTIQASMNNNRGYKSQIVRAISGGASTNIFTQDDQKATYGDGDNHRQMSTMQFLDSPNTTSACTYTIQVGMDGGGEVTFCSSTNTPCVITLMEIAG
tara:strand:- start:350 stop:925 length:576 start_codon:yes stop_codon:yes gene_type:complete